jgi:hypothetical protein
LQKFSTEDTEEREDTEEKKLRKEDEAAVVFEAFSAPKGPRTVVGGISPRSKNNERSPEGAKGW